ncbi:hypothetical protein DFR86_11695 [Acidianus sulfidivorans JP7]|nr:hypothetical protein [Acidianus sulfidivorans]AWR98133.2 hypothetical protein DFR86_11695 [Acidianus sulfidivorans JP7]
MFDPCKSECGPIDEISVEEVCNNFGSFNFLFPDSGIMDILDEALNGPDEILDKMAESILKRGTTVRCEEFLQKNIICTELLAFYSQKEDVVYYIADRLDNYIKRLTLENIASILSIIKYYVDKYVEEKKYAITSLSETLGELKSNLPLIKDSTRNIIITYIKAHELYHWAGRGNSTPDEEAQATAYGLYKVMEKFMLKDDILHKEGVSGLRATLPPLINLITIMKLTMHHKVMPKYKDFTKYITFNAKYENKRKDDYFYPPCFSLELTLGGCKLKTQFSVVESAIPFEIGTIDLHCDQKSVNNPLQRRFRYVEGQKDALVEKTIICDRKIAIPRSFWEIP